MNRGRIVVLFHENEVNPIRYVIHHLAGFWREDGHRVDYVMGTKRFVPADAVIVHVDLSIVPQSYLDFAARYPIVINGRVTDIRKSRVSDQLVRLGDGWAGPVIVKSDLNYGGLPERQLNVSPLKRRLSRLGRLVRRVTGRSGAERSPVLDYGLFESIDEVPDEVFDEPRLVVERFLPEIEDGAYHMRIVQFLGDRYRCTRLRSEHRIIKADRSSSTEDAEPHPEVFGWRERFGLDYGKLDYVVHEGTPVLLDINKTTGATSQYRDDSLLAANRRYLAYGLYDYLA